MTDDEDYKFPNITYSVSDTHNKDNRSEPEVPRPGLENPGVSGSPSNRHSPPLASAGESHWPNAGAGQETRQRQGPAMYEIEDSDGWINYDEVAGTKVTS